MPASIVPLVPEPVQVLSGNFFKCQAKLLRLCRFEFVGIQVKVQRTEESAVAYIIAKHLQNAATLVIAHGIEYVFFVVIIKAYKIFLVICALQVLLHGIIALVVSSIFAVMEFIP